MNVILFCILTCIWSKNPRDCKTSVLFKNWMSFSHTFDGEGTFLVCWFQDLLWNSKPGTNIWSYEICFFADTFYIHQLYKSYLFKGISFSSLLIVWILLLCSLSTDPLVFSRKTTPVMLQLFSWLVLLIKLNLLYVQSKDLIIMMLLWRGRWS